MLGAPHVMQYPISQFCGSSAELKIVHMQVKSFT